MLELLQSNRPADWPEDLPARSYLFNIEPLGLNGETREDLRSFFQRLCIAHNLAPWSVASKLVAPLVSSWRNVNTRSFVNEWLSSAMCGLGQTAADWSRALNMLTARDDLQLLTLGHVRDLLTNFLLASKSGRYCPRCYAEDIARNTDCYNRLLWSIEPVKACPIHELTLLEGCTCGQSTKTGRKFFTPGCCPYCGQNLSGCMSQSANMRDVDAAQRVAELLDVALYFGELKPGPGSVAQFLNHAIASISGGVSAHFARAVGLSKTNMHGWQNGRVVPSFPAILRIAQYCDVGIADVLLGNKRVMVPNEQFAMERATLTSRPPRRSPPCYMTVSRGLEQLIEQGKAVYVGETAKAVGVSDKFLRKRFPEVVQRIVRDRKRAQRSAAQARRAERERAYRNAHNELVQAGVRPSRRRVLGKLHDKGMRMSRHEANTVYHRANSALLPND